MNIHSGRAFARPSWTYVDSVQRGWTPSTSVHSDFFARSTGNMAHESDKADAILAAALELFVERGFHGTSVPSVAERAGVAAGTIYHYFDSKEALVNALYKRWKQEIAARIVPDFPFDRPVREQLRAIWERMADFALKHPKELAFLELHHHGSYLDEESHRIEKHLTEFGI